MAASKGAFFVSIITGEIANKMPTIIFDSEMKLSHRFILGGQTYVFNNDTRRTISVL